MSREGEIIDIRFSTASVDPQIKEHAYAIERRRRRMEIRFVGDLRLQRAPSSSLNHGTAAQPYAAFVRSIIRSLYDSERNTLKYASL